MTATDMEREAAESRSRRSARLEARISRQQKELFRRAAALQGRSLTDFVIASLQEAAVRTLREHEVLTLAQRDREAFVDALLQPPAPDGRLKAAFGRYQERMSR